MSKFTKFVKYHPLKSVKYAFNGLIFALSREPNLSIQIAVGLLMAAVGIWHGKYVVAMANLIFMALVISLEMINSALETLCDLVEPNYNENIKIVKDMAAGAVLIVALVWMIVITYQLSNIFFFENSFLPESSI